MQKKGPKQPKMALHPTCGQFFWPILGPPCLTTTPVPGQRRTLAVSATSPPMVGDEPLFVVVVMRGGGSKEKRQSATPFYPPAAGRPAVAGPPVLPAPLRAREANLSSVSLFACHTAANALGLPQLLLGRWGQGGRLGPRTMRRIAHVKYYIILYFFEICFRIHNFFENTINNGVFHKFA